MAIGCALLDAGKSLLPAADRRHRATGCPDICVLDGDRRIWIEATAPTAGDDGADQVPDLVPLNHGGSVRFQPVRQVQIRISGALFTKTKALARYLKAGVINTTAC